MGPGDIKRMRFVLGWSQERLAREVGVSFCTVNRWERGKTSPSPMALNALKKLAEGMEKIDRRNHARLGLCFPLRVRRLGLFEDPDENKAEDGAEFESYTENISPAGLMFKLYCNLKVGDRLRLSVRLFEGNVAETLSEVRWTLDTGAEKRTGVRFTEGINPIVADSFGSILSG